MGTKHLKKAWCRIAHKTLAYPISIPPCQRERSELVEKLTMESTTTKPH